MSFFDGVPAYRGVINDTGWSDASALQFTGDAANAIVSVYNQQFTPVLEADSKFLVLEFADSTAPAPYSHGYIDVEYISPEYAYNWATLVNAMLRVSSPLTLSTPTAPNTYSTIGFEWPSLSNQQIVLADDAKTLVSLAPGSDSKQFLKTGSAGVAPSWVQVAWGDLTSVPSWLNATYAQYGVAYAATTSSMATTLPGSSGYFLRSGGGGAAPEFKQVDTANLSGITWGSGTYKVAYTPDALGKTFAFSNALTSGKYLGYNGGVPGFVTIPYTDISGTPTLPLAIANGGTGASTAPSAGQLPYASSGTAYSYTNAVAASKYLGYSGGLPTFVTIPYTDITGTPTIPTLPLAIADGGTGVSTAPSAGQLPYASSGTAYSYTNAVATSKYLGYNAGVPGFVTISYNDLADLPYLPLVILSTPTNGQLLIGNTSTNAFEVKTLTGTSNRVTVTNGAGSITLSGPQDIGTSSSPSFAQLNVASTNTKNPFVPIAAHYTTTTSEAFRAVFVNGYITTADTKTGSTIDLFSSDTQANAGFGSSTISRYCHFRGITRFAFTTCTNYYGCYMPAPTFGTGGSITNGWGGYFEKPAGGTVAIGAYAENLCVGSSTASTNPPTNGVLVQGAVKNLNLSANSLVATDGSQQLTSTTSGLSPTLTGLTLTGTLSVTGVTTATGGINYGDTTLTKYKVVTGATTTMTYNGGTGTLTYDYVIIGKHVTINFHIFAVTTGGAAAVMTCTLAAELSTTAAGHATLAQVNSTTQPGAFTLSGTSATFGRFDGSSLTTYPASTANCGLWDSNVSFILY